jgi:hypothetical protein
VCRCQRGAIAGHPIMEDRMNLISNRQPGLPFEFDAFNDTTLRAAHARSQLKMPFEAAVRDKALAICLRCLARAQLKKQNRHG